jgi:hypothetical protein
MRRPIVVLPAGLIVAGNSSGFAAEFPFRYHFISRELPVKNKTTGDYGLTVLADVDGDGDIDICSKPWGPRPWNGNGGRMHVDSLENQAKSTLRK